MSCRSRVINSVNDTQSLVQNRGDGHPTKFVTRARYQKPRNMTELVHRARFRYKHLFPAAKVGKLLFFVNFFYGHEIL
jgi:hypothetical protein